MTTYQLQFYENACSKLSQVYSICVEEFAREKKILRFARNLDGIIMYFKTVDKDNHFKTTSKFDSQIDLTILYDIDHSCILRLTSRETLLSIPEIDIDEMMSCICELTYRLMKIKLRATEDQKNYETMSIIMHLQYLFENENYHKLDHENLDSSNPNICFITSTDKAGNKEYLILIKNCLELLKKQKKITSPNGVTSFLFKREIVGIRKSRKKLKNGKISSCNYLNKDNLLKGGILC